MAQSEQFINWLTNNPTAIVNAVNSVFGASGTNHSVGLVPDPGSSAGTSRYLREDSSFAQVAYSQITGTPSIPTQGIVSVKIQTFSSGGTYTPSTGMTFALMFCVGSGGAGGGVVGNSTEALGGGGGGSGGLSVKLATAAAVGASQTVTIGAAATGVSGAAGNNGHATSIGTLCIANGGTGGNLNDGSTGVGQGGAGASAGTGDITIAGRSGNQGILAFGSITIDATSGDGGNAPLFSGGAPSIISGAAANPGNAGTAPGGGGSGAAVARTGSSNAAGGASLAGFAFVIEFCNQ